MPLANTALTMKKEGATLPRCGEGCSEAESWGLALRTYTGAGVRGNGKGPAKQQQRPAQMSQPLLYLIQVPRQQQLTPPGIPLTASASGPDQARADAPRIAASGPYQARADAPSIAASEPHRARAGAPRIAASEPYRARADAPRIAASGSYQARADAPRIAASDSLREE